MCSARRVCNEGEGGEERGSDHLRDVGCDIRGMYGDHSRDVVV